MSLRRAGLLALPLLVVACTDVTQQPLPPDLVFARFSSPNIPTPNDLALAALVTRSPLVNACGTQFDACAQPPNAQAALLCAFRAAGGFPSDQEVPITIPFIAKRWDSSVAPEGEYVQVTSPAVDPASLNANTVTVVRVDGADPVPLVFGTDFTVSSAAGGACTGTGKDTECVPATVTIRKASVGGSRRWTPGARYVAAVRGGPSGLTIGGKPVQADSAIALAIPHRDITKKENQPLGGAIPDSQKEGQCGFGSNADEIALLKNVSDSLWNARTWANAPAGTPFPGAWFPLDGQANITPAFDAIDLTFPYAETASVATFGVAASAGPVVLIDSGSGAAPLPFDLIRTVPPVQAGGPHTIAFNDAFGPAAAGLTTLDGFSTTAMVLAQTSVPVDASTVTGQNVHLFRLTKDAAGAVTGVTLLEELKFTAGSGGNPFTAKYVAEPTPIIIPQGSPLTPTLNCPAAGGCSPIIGLQPAVGAPLAGSGPSAPTVYLPPLDQATSYAVVVTNRVKDMLGNALVKPTVAKILLDFNPALPFSNADGSSALPGVTRDTASALKRMQTELQAVLAALPATTTRDQVVTAYTFRTQTNTLVSQAIPALGLGAVPTGIDLYTAAQIGTDYGLDPAVAFPGTAINGFAEVTFDTRNKLTIEGSQGAFHPTDSVAETIRALVVIPDPALVTGACPAGFPAGRTCAPLVVFRHGIPGSKGQMLLLAEAMAAKGFVVAAIDGEKFGDRTYCGASTQAAADQQCLPPSTCVNDPALKTAVDAGVVGRCEIPGTPGNFVLRKRIDCTAANPLDCLQASATAKGLPFASGNFFVSLNLFRTRDSFRQDIIDQSALLSALAPTASRADPFADHLGTLGLAINPDEIYFASVSLGSANSMLSVAVNPRFKKGAFQSGFSTIVDDYSNPESSDFAALVALLGSATPPIVPGTSGFLQFLQVAKWILDPADAANYGALLQSAGKPVLHQMALCDSRIPNAQSQYFSARLGLAVPAPGTAGTGFTQWFINSPDTAVCPTDRVGHGFLIDPTPAPTLTAQSQASFADFLATGSAQPITVRP